MRRFIGFLFILILLTAIGFFVYASIAELPAPLSEVEAPAVGVGFGD
ncbi:MAG: hypothetical protein AAFN79_05975 [Pseudomonadota bacterium]